MARKEHVSYLRDMGDPGEYNPYVHMGFGASKSFNRSHSQGGGRFLSSSSQRLSWASPHGRVSPGPCYLPNQLTASGVDHLWSKQRMAKEKKKLSSSFLSYERNGSYLYRAPVPAVGEYETSKAERAITRKVLTGAAFKMTSDRFHGAEGISYAPWIPDTPCAEAPQNHTLAFAAKERLKRTGAAKVRPGFASKSTREDLFKPAKVRV